jgi:hypothetical protein
MKQIHGTFPQHGRHALYILTILTVGFSFSGPANAEESCTELLKNRCETCHYLTRVCYKVEKEMGKTRLFGGPEGVWKRIMKNMVKQGAKLNSKEEDILVKCLSEPSAEALSICKIKK